MKLTLQVGREDCLHSTPLWQLVPKRGNPGQAVAQKPSPRAQSGASLTSFQVTLMLPIWTTLRTTGNHWPGRTAL